VNPHGTSPTTQCGGTIHPTYRTAHGAQLNKNKLYLSLQAAGIISQAREIKKSIDTHKKGISKKIFMLCLLLLPMTKKRRRRKCGNLQLNKYE